MSVQPTAGQGEGHAAVLHLSDALGKLPGPGGAPFAELFRHGTLSVEVFAPRGVDTQQPHERDELYVVARGSGRFVYGARRAAVAAGDLLFVPARLPHRFEGFSDDFVTGMILPDASWPCRRCSA